jgi:hypothetical protein
MISTFHCCCSLSYAKLALVLVDHMRWTTYIRSLWQNYVKYHSMLLTASSRSIEWLVHAGELMWAKRARKNQEKDSQLLRKANLQNSGKIRWHRIYKLGGTEFPRISKGWKGNCRKYFKAHYSWFKNDRRLRKYSLWDTFDLISHILICLWILTEMWNLLP